jgi:hypothetical protein
MTQVATLRDVVFTGAAKVLAARETGRTGTCLATGRPRTFPKTKWAWLATMVFGREEVAKFFGGESCEALAPEPAPAHPPTIMNYYDRAAGWES